MILVYTRLGTVNFAMFSVSETDSTLELSEETELEFDIVGGERWVGATSLAICSGQLTFRFSLRGDLDLMPLWYEQGSNISPNPNYY